MVLDWEKLDGRNAHDAGRALLARMYRAHYGHCLPEIAVTQRGKPYFVTGSPYFSISHCKNHVFCCLSDVPVGIDAEEMDRKIDLRLTQKILSPAEQRDLEKCADKQAALLRLWVLKEAAAKLSGEGLRGYPNHTAFHPEDNRIQIIDGCYVAIFKEETHAV